LYIAKARAPASDLERAASVDMALASAFLASCSLLRNEFSNVVAVLRAVFRTETAVLPVVCAISSLILLTSFSWRAACFCSRASSLLAFLTAGMALRPRFPLGTPVLLLSGTWPDGSSNEECLARFFAALRLPLIVTVTGLPVASRIGTSTLVNPYKPWLQCLVNMNPFTPLSVYCNHPCYLSVQSLLPVRHALDLQLLAQALQCLPEKFRTESAKTFSWSGADQFHLTCFRFPQGEFTC
jgi:hypothetical protein